MKKREEFAKEVGKEGTVYKGEKAFVTGKDLIDLGMKQGKELGDLLKDLYQRQLEGEITSREQALEIARDEI